MQHLLPESYDPLGQQLAIEYPDMPIQRVAVFRIAVARGRLTAAGAKAPVAFSEQHEAKPKQPSAAAQTEIELEKLRRESRTDPISGLLNECAKLEDKELPGNGHVAMELHDVRAVYDHCGQQSGNVFMADVAAVIREHAAANGVRVYRVGTAKLAMVATDLPAANLFMSGLEKILGSLVVTIALPDGGTPRRPPASSRGLADLLAAQENALGIVARAKPSAPQSKRDDRTLPPVTAGQLGDMLAMWLAKSSTAEEARKIARAIRYNDAPFFGRRKAKLRLIQALIIANTVVCLEAMMRVFEPAQAGLILFPFLNAARERVFKAMSSIDAAFEERHTKQANLQLEMLGKYERERMPDVLAVLFGRELGLGQDAMLFAQSPLAGHFRAALDENVEVLSRMTLTSDL